MRTPLPMSPGLFYDFEDGYFLPTQEIAVGLELSVGLPVPAGGCMFTINWVRLASQTCGYLFRSKFEVINKGGFIVTFLQNGRGRAVDVETPVKSEHLLLYNYPNRGSIAISPLVNDQVLAVFEEQ